MGSYWQRFVRVRLTRRRFLVASALAAAWGVTGCREGNRIPALEITPGATPSPRARIDEASRGGIYRAFNFDALAIDTFDPHQTQFGPLYNMHSAVFSKVLKYDDEVQQTMSPDLADGMPEQVDEVTYVIRLRRTARFHDTPRIRRLFPSVAGRPVTAEDVRYSIERQIDPSSPQRARYQRAGQWAVIERIDVSDPYTLRIVTKAPVAPFLHFLADRNAFVIPRELVDEDDEMNAPERMVGSGPFMLDEFKPVEVVRVVRNPDWFAADDLRDTLGPGRPFLDGYESLWDPQSDSTMEAAFLSRQVDVASFLDQSNIERLRRARPELVLQEWGIAGYINTRLLIDRPPFDDERVRRALHLAVDRKRLAEQLFKGPPGERGFLLSGPVAWPMVRWAIPQEDLEKKPGYRSDPEARAEDLAEARKLWDAAKADGRAPDVIEALFAGQPRFIPEIALPEMQRMLMETLGVRLEAEVDGTGYTQLFQCLSRNQQGETQGTCAFTWGFDNGWIDLDDWVYPYFHSQGTKNSFGLRDDQLDAMLEAQRREFNFDRRRELGLNIQHFLLDRVNARLEYANPVARALHWPYVKNAFTSTWLGDNFRFADVWLDRSDPSIQGRP